VVRVALDAMGGDSAPRTEVAGVVDALAELPDGFLIQLVGRSGVVEAELARREHPVADLDRLGQGHPGRRHLRRVNHLPARGRRGSGSLYGTSTILPW